MYESLLNATCTIRRRPITGNQDAMGADTGEYDYADHLAGVACRLEGIGFTPMHDLDDAVRVSHRLFLPVGTDIKHTDRVANVTLDGAVTLANAEVESVDPTPGGMNHHVEAMLMEIK